MKGEFRTDDGWLFERHEDGSVTVTSPPKPKGSASSFTFDKLEWWKLAYTMSGEYLDPPSTDDVC